MITQSRLQADLLYADTELGAFWCSKNNGKDWQDYSNSLTNQYIRSICPPNFQTSRVYVAMMGINN